MPQRRFRFRLQSVLEYKQKRKEDEEKELARKKEIAAGEERQLRTLEQLRETRRQELAEKSALGKVNVDEIKMYHEHQKKLNKEIASQNIRVQQAQADVETQRQKLIEAAKEVRIFEKLREKQHQGFLAELDEEERKLLDDVATTKSAREKKGLL